MPGGYVFFVWFLFFNPVVPGNPDLIQNSRQLNFVAKTHSSSLDIEEYAPFHLWDELEVLVPWFILHSLFPYFQIFLNDSQFVRIIYESENV